MHRGWAELLAGLAAGGVGAAAGYALGALSLGAAALLILFTVLASVAGGWAWGVVQVLAVLSVMLWQHYRNRRLPADRAGRVSGAALAANLGWPAVLAAWRLTIGEPRLVAAYVGALAAVAADGWATHVGMLSAQPPRMLISRRRVAKGMPGAVTLLGHIAALNAAWLVGLAALFLLVAQSARGEGGQWNRSLRWLPLCATLGGLAGDLVDSFLGGTAQALYYCEQCQAYSETRVHHCGRSAKPVRGWPWMTDNTVNLVSSVVGAAVSATLYWGLARSGGPW